MIVILFDGKNIHYIHSIHIYMHAKICKNLVKQDFENVQSFYPLPQSPLDMLYGKIDLCVFPYATFDNEYTLQLTKFVTE